MATNQTDKNQPRKQPKGFGRNLVVIRHEMGRLADEIRLKLHLGGMDAKDAWERLEPRLHDFEQKADAVTHDVEAELERVAAILKDELHIVRQRIANKGD